jgi:hypothetical protein
LFLPSASVSEAANKTENVSSIGGERQSTAWGRRRGRASGRSKTTRGGLAQLFGF